MRSSLRLISSILACFTMVTLSTASATFDDKEKAELEYSHGLSLYHSAQFKLAIDHLNSCVTENPHHPRAWNLLGLTYLNTGDLPEAEKAFKKAIEENSHDPYAYNNLGRVYMRQKNVEEAEKAFRKQIEVNGHDKYASYNLALLLRDRGDYEGSIKQMENAEFYSGPNAKLHVDFGEIYLRAGKPDKARVELDNAVEISPTPTIWNNVAYTMARHQLDLDKARRLAESAITVTAARLRAADLSRPTRREFGLSSALASYWDTLGWVYFQQGEYVKAEPYLKSSWQVSHHAEIAEHLGELEEKRGNRDAAAKWYALASVVDMPSTVAKDKLLQLAPQEAEQLKTAAKDALARESRMNISNQMADGDFKLAIAYSSDSTPAITSMSNNTSVDLLQELRKAKYPITFPDNTPTTLLLASEAKCSSSTCELSILPPEVSARDEMLTLGASPDTDVANSPGPALASGITPPQVIKEVEPYYPEDARQQRLQGPVRLELKVDTDGKPDELRAVDGNPIFFKAAIDSVKKWRFKPATKDGNPVPVKITVMVDFRLFKQP